MIINEQIMSSEILEKLFHSRALVKILRLFLNNPHDSFHAGEISEKTRTESSQIKKEIANLVDIKLLIAKKKAGKSYYGINFEFVLLDELRRLVFKASPTSSERIMQQVEKIGQIRLLVISGALINSEKGRVDILIVGEHISKSRLKNFLVNTEAEIGKSINYVSMSTDEYRYRKSMFDKFVIDIMEAPHKVLIDKIKVEV